MTLRRVTGISDPWILVAVALLCGAGALVIQAIASHPSGLSPMTAETARQLIYLGVGTVLMLVAARTDYTLLRRFAPAAYGLAILLLLAVLVLGSSEYGARRWIAFGPLTIQPSEFAKLALVVGGAALVAERTPGWRPLVVWLGVLMPVVGLVLIEPDLGTSLAILATWAVMVIAWGLHWRLLGGLAAAGLAVVPLAFAIAVPDYQRERIAVFVDPERDPLGTGFTVRQVEVALGAGGWTGDGLFNGVSALDGLSTRTSDFVFAQTGEALGLLGALVILAMYALIAWRGMRAAALAPDAFGRLLAAGLTAMIVAQAAMHIAVNTRLFPATGIALPFISQGGSALVAMLIAAGILQSIAAHRPPTSREQWTGERWR
jgi:cell division protein FtsW (lipid II flippase)